MIHDFYRGYEYWIRRTNVGILTAYVDIDQNGYLIKKIDKIDDYLSAHGGITFCEKINKNMFADGFSLPVGHVCIGWDYGHYYDIDMNFNLSSTSCFERKFCYSKQTESDVLIDVKDVIDQILQKYDR